MKEYVVLVDKNDNVVGIEDKLKAHKLALLHRAFSVFIYRKVEGTLEFLLQQRHKNKYHSGGLWSNTCCSHPRLDEPILLAGQRRLKEELSIETNLNRVGAFQYFTRFDNGLTEHELDHVLVGEYKNSTPIIADENEVQAFRWISVETLRKELAQYSKQYTSWFQPALRLVLEDLCLNF